MKKLIVSILVIIFTLDICSIAAYEDSGVGYTFKYTSSGTITGYNNEDSLKYTNIVIPDKIDGVDIKAIDGSVFQNCSKIESIKLPSNLEKIGSSAFAGCSSLKSIDLPDTLKELGRLAFMNCLDLEEVNIPSKIEIIRDFTFQGCTSLKKLICQIVLKL